MKMKLKRIRFEHDGENVHFTARGWAARGREATIGRATLRKRDAKTLLASDEVKATLGLDTLFERAA